MTKEIYAPCLIVLLSATCLTTTAFAQTRWWRTYGGYGDDYGYSVQQTTDGGYVITDYTTSFGAGTPSYGNVYLVKTNATGDTLWTRTYGGTNDDGGISVQQTIDGGYIITGWTHSFNVGNSAVYLIKTNASGDTLWTRTYGGGWGDAATSVRQTSDGGYVITGYDLSVGAGNSAVYLVKTNGSGDTVWTRTYGGTGDEQGYSVQQTTDGGYIVAGYTSSFGAGDSDVYLIKTNAAGDTLWTRTYGGTNEDVGNFIDLTSDGGYIVAGYTHSFGPGTPGSDNVYLIKTSASGDTLWTRTYGGANYDEGYSVQQTTDGGYVVAGRTTSFGAGRDDVYLIRTNTSGDTLWTRTYGGPSWDDGYAVQQTTDRGYVIAGYTYSFGAGIEDVYLIKTDANGYGIQEPVARQPARPTRPLVQPNPFISFARVPGHENDAFTLSDVAGRQVAVCKGDRIGAGLRPGIYFLSPVGLKTSKAVTTTIIKVGY